MEHEMQTENINLELARRRVERYGDGASNADALARNGENGNSCNDLLRRGIEAYRWLVRAEETLREACYEGLFTFTPEVKNSLAAMYESWLKSSELAEPWINAHCQTGEPLEYLHDFRSAQESVEEILAHVDWNSRAQAAREDRMAEEPW